MKPTDDGSDGTGADDEALDEEPAGEDDDPQEEDEEDEEPTDEDWDEEDPDGDDGGEDEEEDEEDDECVDCGVVLTAENRPTVSHPKPWQTNCCSVCAPRIRRIRIASWLLGFAALLVLILAGPLVMKLSEMWEKWKWEWGREWGWLWAPAAFGVLLLVGAGQAVREWWHQRTGRDAAGAGDPAADAEQRRQQVWQELEEVKAQLRKQIQEEELQDRQHPELRELRQLREEQEEQEEEQRERQEKVDRSRRELQHRVERRVRVLLVLVALCVLLVVLHVVLTGEAGAQS
jgi:hypothetical protein